MPTSLVEAARLQSVVEVAAADGQIIVRNPTNPRAGWAKAYRAMAARGDDELIDGPLGPLSSWDLEEWQW